MLHRSFGRLAKLTLPGVLLLAASCTSFSWTSRPIITEEQEAAGIKSVQELRNDYESQRYWAFWRDNLHGKWDSLGRRLSNLHQTFDRHFMSYDWDEPNATR